MTQQIQQDNKGALWRRRIEEQGVSGRSIREFCSEAGISKVGFYYWKRKLLSPVQRRFITLSRSSSPRSPRIHLPNGVQIDLGSGLDTQVVQEMIQKLCGVGHPPKDGYRART